MRTAGRIAAAPLVLVAAVAAGTGWLELLRRLGLLGAGPLVSGALPLDRLAGHDAQPLLRVLAAWLPTGLAAGAALVALTGWSRPARAALAGAGSFALVFAAGALADAVTASDPLGSHVGAQWDHDATWLIPALLTLGSLMAGRPMRWRGARAAARDASRPGRGAAAAA